MNSETKVEVSSESSDVSSDSEAEATFSDPEYIPEEAKNKLGNKRRINVLSKAVLSTADSTGISSHTAALLIGATL